MEPDFLEELASYVGFTDAHARALAALKPLVEPSFSGIVDRFYETIMRNPHAAAVFTGGPPQIERQKTFLHEWLHGLLSGRYDSEYLRLRARIGRTHVRIRLDQRYAIGAMNVVRSGLHDAICALGLPSEAGALAHTAVDQICDIELAIMVQTYAEDYTTRIRDREKLATLGQLAGFVGHELRNPLAVMQTSLHLLRRRLPHEDEHVARHTRKLGEQLTACSDIISALLELARDRPPERTAVAVAPLIASVLEGMSTEPSIEVVVRVAPELPPARVDEQQLRQVVANLVTNATEAVEQASDKKVSVEASAEGAEVLLLVVEDSGPGVAEQLLPRLFEPLATTREKGLGLGLALCRSIVEKHGGDIRALRGALGGARFELRFPGAFGGPR